MENERKRIPVLIDTDLGDDVDDAAALLVVLNSPELDLRGITTVYKDTAKRAEMVKDLLKQKGVEGIPVIAGSERALIEPTPVEEPIQYAIVPDEHRDEKESDVEITGMAAAQFILKEVRETEGLVIVAIGMLTNLAIAFLIDPETMKRAKIVGMGGEFQDSQPEWNILCDPEAARIVTDRAEHLTLFGLEVTKYCGISDEEMERLGSKTSVMSYYLDGARIFRQKTGYPFTLHDVLPIVWLIDPKISMLEKCDYTVALEGKLSRGAVIKQKDAYRLQTKCRKDFYYARSVDFAAFFRLMDERLY